MSVTESSSQRTLIRRPPAIQEKVGGLLVYAQRRRSWKAHLYRFDSHVLASKITIGRTRQRTFRLRDKTVSKLHCVIRRQRNGSYTLQDQHSLVGTWVSDPDILDGRWHQCKIVTLRLGMRIRIGNTHFLVTDNRGCCPIERASRYSEFCRRAWSLYGTISIAARAIGLSPARLAKAVCSPKKDTGR